MGRRERKNAAISHAVVQSRGSALDLVVIFSESTDEESVKERFSASGLTSENYIERLWIFCNRSVNEMQNVGYFSENCDKAPSAGKTSEVYYFRERKAIKQSHDSSMLSCSIGSHILML